MKTKIAYATILDSELHKYEKDVGEPKYTISLCQKHHVELMKETFPRSMYKGRSIVQSESMCMICEAAPLTLVTKEKS